MRRRDVLIGASLIAAPVRLARAASGRTLNIGLGGAFTTVDPHFYHATPNHTVAQHMYERLVTRRPDGTLIPGLAAEWTVTTPTTWEFKLQPGVTFHDGGPFTADDVVFTFERARDVPNSPGGFGTFLRAIVKAEAIGPLLLRVTTTKPAPDLLANLTYVGIVSRRAGATATTSDYNSGKAAIGTGPYRFVSYEPNTRVSMARYDGYWGAKQPWEAVNLRLIANPAARTAALLSGDVDLIDTPSVSDLPRLRSEAGIEVVSIPGVRVMYFVPDLLRDDGGPFVTDLAGKPLPANPFRDRRVREALTLSINRAGLADRIMSGTATPSGQWLPPGTFSYAPSVKPPPFDLARAKQLLAEAGYKDGFRLTLHSPNDRYPNDAQQAQAVAQMWTRAGLQVSVETLPWASFSARGMKGEFAMMLWGWGSATFEASYMLASCFHTYDRERSLGIYNYGRYSNPGLDPMIDTALTEVDAAKREQVLIAATETVMADMPVMPTVMLQNLWALRRGVRMMPRADEYTLAMDAIPA